MPKKSSTGPHGRSPQTGTVIALEKLTKSYGVGEASFEALSSISLEIKRGEFVAIMGPSGCGKTTLLNILGLLDSATSGEYLLDNDSVARLGGAKRARIRSSRIGFVFQHFNLIQNMTVLENVALPLVYNRVGKLRRERTASTMLKSLFLSEREYYKPYQLSGGQAQRAAIARALVNNPSIILADEPTGNLDSKATEIIMGELRRIHARGNTIIMVTHNPDLTAYADRLIRMRDGKIASDTKFPANRPDPRDKKPLGRHRSRSAA
jgi:putative ABC transport system ATP-binding protein